ncbi:Signal transduction histidine kinase [Pedobacter westerhofensis]|uniref:histidine kinase n=1 Tax=Pedobacter westerhofensis TaxID=425512 RepID=A0A521ABK2_9SPHI|nr:ATP-binding protein [Pedobacter westerhofensis]SMO32158.1 Signal transduction histidine kinase [Pedobacter westerhofensis]
MHHLSNPSSLLSVLNESEVATAIYEDQEIIIRFANQAMIKFWGKDQSIIGKALEDGVPELRGQPFKRMLQQVLLTGITDEGVIPATTMVSGRLQTAYYEYQYKPIFNADGIPYCIIHTAKDVTKLYVAEEENQSLTNHLSVINEELTATNEELLSANDSYAISQRQLNSTIIQLEESEIALRLAIEAANFGTWHIHSITREFITSARLRELFGFNHDDEITIEDAIAQITPDYREYVTIELENAIYNGGDYDVTYPVIGYGDQRRRWLRAIGNLKKHVSGEYSSFTGVVMDITEQKEDDQRKNDFIAMVSHELKTPVTSLNAYIQLLHRQALKKGDEFALGALEKSLKQVKKMTAMINGFLNVSRFESGKIHLDQQTFDLAILVKVVEDEIMLLVNTHNIYFAPIMETIVFGDREKISQVIMNLISNAVKYSPPGSTIQVSCVYANNNAVLGVKDKGIGVKPEDRDRLFDRYYRVENEKTKHVSGFGIGLYLCAEIIKEHGGKIWVESSYGKGSEFRFSLPIGNV